MLGAQHRLAIAEPFGRLAVQLATAGPQQGVVNRVADQGVAEQQVVANRPHQLALDQAAAGVVWAGEEMAQRVEGEALAEHRGRLERLTIRRIELIHARLDQALHRARHDALHALLGMAQQLLEKQRIAGCAFDAASGELAARPGLDAGQRLGLAGAQWAQIQRHQRAAADARPPRLIQRVASDAGGHDQERRTAPHRAGEIRQILEGDTVGPMEVLDQQQPRLMAAGVRVASSASVSRLPR